MVVRLGDSGDVYAAKVEGRHLSPLIHQFDNESDVESLLGRLHVPCESIVFNGKCGYVSWPDGFARIGDWLVVDGKSWSRFESLDALRKDYPSLCP